MEDHQPGDPRSTSAREGPKGDDGQTRLVPVIQVTGDSPPQLTPGAAGALLRIVVKASAARQASEEPLRRAG